MLPFSGYQGLELYPGLKNFLPYNFGPRKKMPEIFVIEIFPPGFFSRLIFYQKLSAQK